MDLQSSERGVIEGRCETLWDRRGRGVSWVGGADRVGRCGTWPDRQAHVRLPSSPSLLVTQQEQHTKQTPLLEIIEPIQLSGSKVSAVLAWHPEAANLPN